MFLGARSSKYINKLWSPCTVKCPFCFGITQICCKGAKKYFPGRQMTTLPTSLALTLYEYICQNIVCPYNSASGFLVYLNYYYQINTIYSIFPVDHHTESLNISLKGGGASKDHLQFDRPKAQLISRKLGDFCIFGWSKHRGLHR